MCKRWRSCYGRVTEEINTLKSYGIEHEIIPGVTSASAAVASLNIGLTMRGIAPSVTFQLDILKSLLIKILI